MEVAGGGEFLLKSFPPERKRIDIGDYYSDWNLIQETLGWKPATPLKKGLKKTLEYYRQNLPHYL
ncbi:MAG: hypothetical protein EBS01_15065 [Verrucomicrobia bacterium]|nr:hypothetical protein [Verrucomicrobiota bacterium]